jgi:hypothetical protein
LGDRETRDREQRTERDVAKLILTNSAALQAKYGQQTSDVWAAVDVLIAADGQRGIETRLVKLDDASGPAGGAAVVDFADGTQTKRAVDAVVAELSPEYLMLLGGPDVIPHCTLENPTGDADGAMLPSDLPYACDAPASVEVQDFLAPTRVVSRLPDVPAASQPDLLLRVLGVSSGWESRPTEQYSKFLGITAEVWERSTALSLTQIFGNAADMQVSPDDGPAWSDSQLTRLAHFVNCHGAPSTPQYLGQRDDDYPVSHDAALVDGRLEEGTILSAECCYGAELYEPIDGQLGMAFTYLQNGAYSVFGSTTIAYGPPDSNANADDICRLFLASILTGASVGRAGLEARQEYIAGSSPLDPVDLKTIAQFIILGDPSVHPAAPEPSTAAATRGAGKAAEGRNTRRSQLEQKGRAVGRAAAYAVRIDQTPATDIVARMRDLARIPAGVETRSASFEIRGGPRPKGRAVRGAPTSPAHIHLLVESLYSPDAPIPPQVAVIAVEEHGRITSLRTVVSR